MKKYFSLLVFSLVIVLSPSCSAQSESEGKGGDVEVTQAKDLIEAKKITTIIDVRTPGEVKQGKIEGSVNININDADFKEKIEALPKDQSYLVYCKSGGRSARAAKIMTEMGFVAVYNMKGGDGAWTSK